MHEAKVAANASLRATASALGIEGERMPLLCECDTAGCSEVALVRVADYRAGLFVVRPGHPHDGVVVLRADEYCLVEIDG